MESTRDGSPDENENGYEVYYIKESGFKLLLAGLGQPGWYGLFSEEPQAGEKQEPAVNTILADLYQNGVIDWDGGGVAVRPPYADMLSCMLEKKRSVTIQPQDPAALIRCCYLSARAVVQTQKSRREKQTLGLAYVSRRQWMRLLEEELVRMETGEHTGFCVRHSENGRIERQMQVQRNGLRSFQITWDKEGAGIRCIQDELGKKLGELLWADSRGQLSQKQGE